MKNTDFDCHFRHAIHSDYDALHKILHACWIEIYSPHVPLAVIERFKADDLVGRHLDAFLHCTEVAAVDGEVVGSISHCFGMVHGLFVKKDFRGNRIGSSLLFNAALDGARSLDVAAFNTKAIQFYKKCGWALTGRHSDDVYGFQIEMLSMKAGTVKPQMS